MKTNTAGISELAVFVHLHARRCTYLDQVCSGFVLACTYYKVHTYICVYTQITSVCVYGDFA